MSRSRPTGMDMRLWTGKTHTTAKRGFAPDAIKSGKETCPEDILSGECPRSGKAWAIERIADAVNEVIA